ncbi:MAG: DNA polymerase III subunit delta' [Nitrospirales bacterium]
MAFREILGHHRPIKWLQSAVGADRLGHAYLFHGEPAIGKRRTALALAQYLHCETPQDTPIFDACGTCRSCHQVEQGIHPDFLIIQPEDPQSQNPKIKIDQIRNIEHLVIYRPLVGSHKICLIDEADSMTQEAANALLKTLEDPPDHCLFLLISSRPEHLLTTIRSRCLTLRFSPLPQVEIYAFLVNQRNMDPADAQFVATFSEGRLGPSLQIDPTELKIKLHQYWALLFGAPPASAARVFDMSEGLVKSHQVQEALHWFWLALRDLLFLALDSTRSPMVYREQESTLRNLAKTIPPSAILQLIQELNQLERGQHRNLNLQIGLEQFFFHLHDQTNLAFSHEPV